MTLYCWDSDRSTQVNIYIQLVLLQSDCILMSFVLLQKYTFVKCSHSAM